MSLWCKYTAMTRKASWELNQHTETGRYRVSGGGFRGKKKKRHLDWMKSEPHPTSDLA